jgi:hypothetical protein
MQKFWLTILVFSAFGNVVSSAVDCTYFAANPWTGVPYAYKYIAGNVNYTVAKQTCYNLGINGSQIVILRNAATTIFVWKNLTQPQGAFIAFTGLTKQGTDWRWIDGEPCDPTDPTDERCYGSCNFSYDYGDYAVFFGGNAAGANGLLDDQTPSWVSGFVCEIPSKFVLAGR